MSDRRMRSFEQAYMSGMMSEGNTSKNQSRAPISAKNMVQSFVGAVTKAPEAHRRLFVQRAPQKMRTALLNFMKLHQAGMICALKPRQRSVRALDKLRAIVAKAPQERRRELLEKIPPRVRCELLKFMESCSHAPVRRPRTASNCGRASVKVSAGQPVPTSCSMGVVGAAGVQPSDVGAAGMQPRVVLGVSRKCGGFIARAKLAPHFHVTTRCQASQRRALQFYAVLERAKDLIEVLPDAALEGDLVRTALQEACEEANLTLAELALSFCALVDAHSVIGRVVTGSYTVDMEQAVSQRNKLLAARAEGWHRLRAEWIDVMRTPVKVRKSGVWGRARPQARSLLEATFLADTAWLQHKAKCQQQAAVKATLVWSQLESNLSRSVTVVAAALDSEDWARHKAMGRACQRGRRVPENCKNHEAGRAQDARWLCVRSQHRTTEEIIPRRWACSAIRVSGTIDKMSTSKRNNSLESFPRLMKLGARIC